MIFKKFSKSKKSVSQSKSHAGMEKSKKEEQEFGPGKKDITICADCGVFYYNKSWHHNLRNNRHLNEDKNIRFATCPACQMIKDKKFEGQIIIENTPNDKMSEITNKIYNSGQYAYRRDPMDRVIKIKKNKNNIEVFTTENQLARNIARQIEKAFKNSVKDIKWSKEESVARVTIRFME